MRTPETHVEYAERIGAPRVVRCVIALGHPSGYVWICMSHGYGFNHRPYPLDHWKGHRLSDRCPVSRLEEWRSRVWEFVDGNTTAVYG